MPEPPRRPEGTPAAPGREWVVAESLELIGAAERLESGGVKRVGKQVVDGYFEGEVGLVTEETPRLVEAFAELRQRMVAETTWRELKLRRALWAEVVARGLPAQTAERVYWTYLWMLHAVEDLRLRRQLAERIAKGELKGAAAEEAIELEAGKTRRGGRVPNRPAVVIERAIEAAERALAAALRAHAFEERSLGSIRTPKAKELVERWRKLIGDWNRELAKLEESMG